MDETASEPLLELDFLSHGTVLMDDLDAARRFYEEFLGLETVKTSQISLAIRLNSDTSVACVALSKLVRKPGREYLRYYNIGLTVGDAADVARSRELALAHKDSYEMRNIGDIEEDHGRVSFLIEDRDGNFWQIMNDQPVH
jgi:catechol 2,3-dioxygenase-like lactoylglutathione lyase family enzyme